MAKPTPSPAVSIIATSWDCSKKPKQRSNKNSTPKQTKELCRPVYPEFSYAKAAVAVSFYPCRHRRQWSAPQEVLTDFLPFRFNKKKCIFFVKFLKFQLQNPCHWFDQWETISWHFHPFSGGRNQQQTDRHKQINSHDKLSYNTAK